MQTQLIKSKAIDVELDFIIDYDFKRLKISKIESDLKLIYYTPHLLDKNSINEIKQINKLITKIPKEKSFKVVVLTSVSKFVVFEAATSSIPEALDNPRLLLGSDVKGEFASKYRLANSIGTNKLAHELIT